MAPKLFPSEGREFRDAATGSPILQITTHRSSHHHPFYYVPCYDDAMRHLVFISHRTGRAEIFTAICETGQLVQLTEHEGLAECSIHPSHDGKHVYFTDRSGAWRVSIEDGREECLVDFQRDGIREKGMVGSAMGTTALSACDRFWAVPVKQGQVSQLYVIETMTGSSELILERDSIGHPQFHPDDASLLRYAGPYYERMWVINRDGSGNRLAYRRNEEMKEWIVHETWRPGSRELVTTKWPHGMIAVDVDSGAVRDVTAFPAWHAMIDRAGRRLVADTTFPDRGLFIIDALSSEVDPLPVCCPGASCQGAHWDTDHCPYDDGPVQVYAPQHTHPHPNFSPDGRRIVYTSDRSGIAQVYECRLDEAV